MPAANSRGTHECVRHTAGWTILLLLAPALYAQAPSLEPSALDLVNCGPVSTIPCFRLAFDATGVPADAPASVTVTANDQSLPPLAASFTGSTLTVTVASPWEDQASLEGRSVDFDVVWRLPDGSVLQPPRLVRWTSGALGAFYGGECTSAERRAAAPQSASIYIWRPLVVFVVFGALWAVALFLAPNWFWPGPGAPDIQPVRRAGTGNPR